MLSITLIKFLKRCEIIKRITDGVILEVMSFLVFFLDKHSIKNYIKGHFCIFFKNKRSNYNIK